MLCYRDRTFCVNQSCKKRCKLFLTPEIEAAAKAFGLPVAVSEFICLNCGEDGKWKLEVEDGRNSDTK